MTAKSKDKKPPRRARQRPDAPLHSIYFYYIKVSPTDPPELRVYCRFDKSTPVTNIVNEITTLTINAFQDKSSPPCLGSKTSDLDWRRKGYVVVMVEGYPLRSPPFSMRPAGHPNPHTFSAVTRCNVPLTDDHGNSVTIMGGYLINTMKHYSRGDDLADTEAEIFEIILNPPLASIYPDSGGTNMGPPIGPP